MSGRADFVAGNTRLRSRLPSLLSRHDYDQLAGRSLPAVIEGLRGTAYRPYLGPPPLDGGAVLDAVTQRLGDVLRGVRGVYGGTAGDVVGVLLARHDLRDVLALLRGARTGQSGADRLAAVMGVGTLDHEAAADVAAAADGATAVTRIVGRRLPDRATARGLRAAWERFEVNADPDEFETTVASEAINGWTALLVRAGNAGRPVLELIGAESDQANLLAVLRDPDGEAPRLLPAGLFPPSALLNPRRGGLASEGAIRTGWRKALDRYALDADLAALEWNLDMTIWHRAVRGLRRGDPLGADVPVGYVIAAECEARNVRLLLLAARRDIGNDVRRLLVA